MAGIVVFDGVCNFCEHTVNFILRHESGAQLLFVPLQTSTGARMLRELGFDPEDAKTFVFAENGKAYSRSAAAIRLARYLRWPWRALAAIWIIPRPLRDYAYTLIAANRYRWFGRKDSCMVPTSEVRKRFVQD
jgi:predicted DCC family thiol-disulfide oxidoreductase YuxK